MSIFQSIADIAPQEIWEGVLARTVDGAQLSFAIVELSPGSRVDEHTHPNEQIGIVLRGSLTFTIDGETRTLGVGDTYRISGGAPHSAVTGADGAVVVDVFSPPRDDWRRFPPRPHASPIWP